MKSKIKELAPIASGNDPKFRLTLAYISDVLSVCFNPNLCEDTHRDWQYFL